MKHKLILLAVMLTAFALTAIAQREKNPDRATYAIIGIMNSSKTDDGTRYELMNPEGRNIKFKYQSHFYGEPRSNEQVSFSLQNADTKRPGKFSGQMIFWSWNEDAQEWQRDVESGSGRSEYESSSIFSIMIVLDCSGSMSNDFSEMKKNAIFLLRKFLDVSEGKGNIRVGVIGFSTVEYSKSHTVDPIPLTKANFDYLCSYINNLNAGGGTALYYSVNKAVDRLRKDYTKNLKEKKYQGSAIIAFTDGHDNTSTDESKGYTTSKEYYEYTKEYFPNQRVNNIPIESYCVGLRGKDITSDNIWKTTINQFNEVFDRFTPIYRISDLHGQFEEIANNLIERNTVLTLRVAKGISGKVGWTFPETEISEKPKPLPQKNRSPWFGFGVEFGVLEGNSETIFGGLTFDMDFSLNDFFALGGHFGLNYGTGMEEYDYSYYDYSTGTYHYYGDKTEYSELGFFIGPEIKLTFSKNNAFIASIGAGYVGGDGTAYVMVGYKTKGSFYITAKGLIGDNAGGALGLGFSWGGKKRQ